MHGRFVVQPFGASPTGSTTAELSAREKEILDLVTDRPKPVRKVAVSSGAQRALAALKRKGLVQICGFTPSDAAHVLDLQSNWSKPAAEKAAQLLVRFREMKMPSPERVKTFCDGSVVGCGAPYRARHPRHGARPEDRRRCLARCCLFGPRRHRPGAHRISAPSVPVVAVGGPVKIYYGEVGKRLGAEIVFPEFCDVANAVGAATGVVVARNVVITVEGDGSGLFRLHGPQGTKKPRFRGRRHLQGGRRTGAKGGARRGGTQMGARARRGQGQHRQKLLCQMRSTTMACSRPRSRRRRSDGRRRAKAR